MFATARRTPAPRVFAGDRNFSAVNFTTGQLYIRRKRVVKIVTAGSAVESQSDGSNSDAYHGFSIWIAVGVRWFTNHSSLEMFHE